MKKITRRIILLILVLTINLILGCTNAVEPLETDISENKTISDVAKKEEIPVEYVYKHPSLNFVFEVPESWRGHFGVLESETGSIFLHYNEDNEYVPILEITRYESADDVSSIEDKVEVEIGENGSEVFVAKTLYENPYNPLNSSNELLIKQYDKMYEDIELVIDSFSEEKDNTSIDEKTKINRIDTSVFSVTLDLPKDNDVVDKKPVKAVQKAVEDNGMYAYKYGFINAEGQFVIDPMYDSAEEFVDGISRVNLNTQNAAIDESGESVLQTDYEHLGFYSEGLMSFSEVDGYYFSEYPNTSDEEEAEIPLFGFVDIKGNVVIKPEYNFAYDFREGLALVRDTDNNYGFIRKDGTYAIEPKYQDASPFSDGLARVILNGQNQYIDATGEILFTLDKLENNPYKFVGESFDEGRAFKLIESTSDSSEEGNSFKWVLINKSNERIGSHEFDFTYSFKNGYAIVEVGDFSGLINRDGEYVLEPEFNRLISGSNGYYTYMKNDKWGYIDINKNYVSPAIYDQAEEFHNGLADVYLCGLKAVINEEGAIIWYQDIPDRSDFLSSEFKWSDYPYSSR